MPLQTTTPAPAPPAQGGAVTVSGTPAPVAVQSSGAAPAEVYRALRSQRNILGDQLETLEDTRRDIVNQLRQGTVSDGDRAGLEQRLAGTDQQIAALTIRIAEADAQVAAAAAVPGATVPTPSPPPRAAWPGGPNESLVEGFLLGGFFLMIPVVLAYARRIWRRSHVTVALGPDVAERIGAMERAIDAVAVEVERIGEGQRFVTQLLAERPKGQLAEGAKDRHV